jgi:hypothetical protein
MDNWRRWYSFRTKKELQKADNMLRKSSVGFVTKIRKDEPNSVYTKGSYTLLYRKKKGKM